MRRISYILMSLAVAMFASCLKVDIQPVQVDGAAMVSLTFKSAEAEATRAGEAVDELNENKINSVQCFFSNDGENIIFSVRKDNLDANGTADNLEFEISSADLAQLSEKCHVFAVVNCEELSIPEDSTIAILKSSTEIALSKTNTKQTSFVMSGSADNLVNADNKLSGTVNVKRVAAKINVILNVEAQIEVDSPDGEDEIWMPFFDTGDDVMSMTFNGKASTTLAHADLTLESSFSDFESSEDFTVTAENFTGVDQPVDGKYVVKMQVPFYTYPTAWKEQNYITLVLPWKQVDANGDPVRYAVYTYQIPVQYDNKRLLSNNLYELTVNVGVLGNLGTEVLIPSYQVVEWGTGKIDAELSRPKYLVVNQNKVVMNNVESYSVGYSSSDPVRVAIVKNPVTTTYIQNTSKYDAVYAFGNDGLTLTDKVVTLNHKLDNTRNDKQYDFKILEFQIRVYQDINGNEEYDNGELNEIITFVQYPAMYVDTEASKGNVYVNGNNSQTAERDDDNWAHVGGSTQGMSGNLYTISVGAFDSSTSQYMICDPRQPSNENIFTFYRVNSNGTADTNTVVDTSDDVTGDGTLTGYRATIEGPDSRNLVAPEFMVASGYGWYQISWENMYAKTSTKYRCAGYQESGYPAGRWRIPTPSELEVIGKLCSEGKIESIFNNGTSYMSSDGPYKYSSSNGSFTSDGGVDANTASVRCVYDTWYWNDKCATVGNFIWAAEGDTSNGVKSNFLVSVE